MGKVSLFHQILGLPAPSNSTEDGFVNEVEDSDTTAKVVEVDDEDEATTFVATKSKLRAKNVQLLDELDERYAGKKMSRKTLEKSMDLPTRINLVALKNKKNKAMVVVKSSSGSKENVLDSDEEFRAEVEETEFGSDGEELPLDSNYDGSNDEISVSEDDSEEEGAGNLSQSEVVRKDYEIETVSAEDKAGEIEKGFATQQQLRIWDTFLEVRIRMQKMLIESNKLPQTTALPKIIEASGSKDEHKLTSCLEKSCSAVMELLDNLVELQETIINQNPETGKSLKKRKATKESDGNEEIPSDEEITSSEDEIKEVKVDKAPEKNTKNGKPKRKKRKVEEYEGIVQKNFENFIPYRNETIQKWNDKTQLSFGKFGKKNASSHEVTTVKQIEHILIDKQRLIKRTQVKRGAYQTIGKSSESAGTDEPQDQRDEEIFDDDDFYHQLLREFIERKTSNLKDPIQLSRHWLELQKLRSKLKRKVDTKASKGRKVRYDVHTKLVNFMAPFDDCPMSESAITELTKSLFGEWK